MQDLDVVDDTSSLNQNVVTKKCMAPVAPFHIGTKALGQKRYGFVIVSLLFVTNVI